MTKHNSQYLRSNNRFRKYEKNFKRTSLASANVNEEYFGSLFFGLSNNGESSCFVLKIYTFDIERTQKTKKQFLAGDYFMYCK